MRRLVLAVVVLGVCAAGPARAGYTETLDQWMILVDGAYVRAWIDKRWDDAGSEAALIDPIERFEPGGGRQGTLRPSPQADYELFVTRLQLGILDNLSLGIGIPVVIRSEVDLNLAWESGDYQVSVGRVYSEDDFWAWAQSMGQSKPKNWKGNDWTMSDVLVGLRLRWSDWVPAMVESGWAGAVSFFAGVPTGKDPDPEQLGATGTTLFDLRFQGDLALHVAFEKSFERSLDGRLSLGVDLFYEFFLPRTRKTPTGEVHPLLLTQAPYVGDEYTVKPGDFSGFSVRADIVPWKGPAIATWLSGGDSERAANLPPLLAIGLQYSFVHMQQSDWSSNYAPWDWDQETLWKPGYRNVLEGSLTVSLFRVGAPLQLYAVWRTSSLIPGKNTRASDVLTAGLRIPIAF